MATIEGISYRTPPPAQSDEMPAQFLAVFNDMAAHAGLQQPLMEAAAAWKAMVKYHRARESPTSLSVEQAEVLPKPAMPLARFLRKVLSVLLTRKAKETGEAVFAHRAAKVAQDGVYNTVDELGMLLTAARLYGHFFIRDGFSTSTLAFGEEKAPRFLLAFGTLTLPSAFSFTLRSFAFF